MFVAVLQSPFTAPLITIRMFELPLPLQEDESRKRKTSEVEQPQQPQQPQQQQQQQSAPSSASAGGSAAKKRR
jgi:hypothetical protein